MSHRHRVDLGGNPATGRIRPATGIHGRARAHGRDSPFSLKRPVPFPLPVPFALPHPQRPMDNERFTERYRPGDIRGERAPRPDRIETRIRVRPRVPPPVPPAHRHRQPEPGHRDSRRRLPEIRPRRGIAHHGHPALIHRPRLPHQFPALPCCSWTMLPGIARPRRTLCTTPRLWTTRSPARVTDRHAPPAAMTYCARTSPYRASSASTGSSTRRAPHSAAASRNRPSTDRP